MDLSCDVPLPRQHFRIRSIQSYGFLAESTESWRKMNVQLFLAGIGEECLLGETVEYIREIKPKVKNAVVARDYEVEQNPLRTDERCRLC